MGSSRWAFAVASVLAFVTANTAQAVTVSRKFPIATTTQMSVGAAFDGTNFLVALQGDVTDQNNVGAQLVSQSGTKVGPLISTGHTGGAPTVAFDGTNYLLVWADDATSPKDRVYGQLISPSGILVGAPFAIGPASGGQHGIVAAAFGGTNYLVAWEDRRNDTDGNNQCDPGEGTCTDIWGQFVTPSGALHGSAIPLSIEEDNQREPAVAFDGTRFLVAWDNRQHSGLELWDVNGRFITEDGILSDPLVISQTSSPSHNPVSIAFDGHNYLLAWNKDIGLGYPNPIIWDVYGRVVSPSGALLVPEFPISAAAGTHPFPWVAFDGTNYLVTWTDLRNDANGDLSCDPGEGTCWDVYAQFVSPIGCLVGSEFPISDEAGDQGISPVVFGAGKYLVAWGDRGLSGEATGDLYGAFVSPLGACVGDCDGRGTVTVNEIITMVNIALGNVQVCTCGDGDGNGDGQITVDEILQAVNNALNGCVPSTNVAGYWDVYVTYQGASERGPYYADISQSGSRITLTFLCLREAPLIGTVSANSVSLSRSLDQMLATGTVLGDTIAGSFAGSFQSDNYSGPGTWRAVRDEPPTASECTASTVNVICVGFPDGHYAVAAFILDPDSLISSSTISGPYIQGTSPLAKGVNPQEPTRWLTNPNIQVSQEGPPPLPLTYVVQILFTDRTTSEVSRSVWYCSPAE